MKRLAEPQVEFIELSADVIATSGCGMKCPGDCGLNCTDYCIPLESTSKASS